MDLDLEIFKIKSNNIKPAKGKILIAEPFLQGYYFSRAIILLTEHSAEGSMGIVLNKPLDLTLSKLIDNEVLFPAIVSCGGPMSPDKLFYLHTLDDLPGAQHIIDNLYFGGDFGVLNHILIDNPEFIHRIRFFIGYSGWEKGQLKSEIKENSWVVSDISVSSIIENTKELWKTVVADLGERYAIWKNFPRNPDMN